MTRKVFIGGNWKCNGTRKSVDVLVNMLNHIPKIPENMTIVVSPPTLHIERVFTNLKKDFSVAIQNIWKESKAGAWTGEITADLVVDFGLKWVILGHSERRSLLQETNEDIALKIKIALESGLNVIACIGEHLQDRDNGMTMEICISQLEPILKIIPKDKINNIVIAYEPVWAIGTGVTASPDQAQHSHQNIRAYLKSVIGYQAAESIQIIYGGSVKANNCKQLIEKPDIDGFLVGGASLTSDFEEIIKCSQA